MSGFEIALIGVLLVIASGVWSIAGAVDRVNYRIRDEALSERVAAADRARKAARQ